MSRKSTEPASPAPRRNTGHEEVPASALKHLDEALDEALIESFPASDPIAIRVTRVVK